MKINDKIDALLKKDEIEYEDALAAGKRAVRPTYYSYEYFPPKTPAGKFYHIRYQSSTFYFQYLQEKKT